MCASTPNVVVLAAVQGEQSNVHYLHPVSLSSSIKPAAVQNVSYDPSRGSTLLFTTDLQGWTALPISSSLPSLPLLMWFTGDRILYLSLDLYTATPQFHWSYPVDDRSGDHFIYSNLTRSYGSFSAVNDIGSGPASSSSPPSRMLPARVAAPTSPSTSPPPPSVRNRRHSRPGRRVAQ